MSERIYHQYCPIARALEHLGGRWTLLILRELETGPKRYTDLMSRLQGIGTNMLAQRVRELEQSKIISRITLPPPACSKVYVLTPLGDMIRPVLTHLAAFGEQLLSQRPEDQMRPEWLARLLLTRYEPGQAAVEEEVEFRVENAVFHLRLGGDRPRIQLNAAHNPALIIKTDVAGLLDLARGHPVGTARFVGHKTVKKRFFHSFGINSLSAVA